MMKYFTRGWAVLLALVLLASGAAAFYFLYRDPAIELSTGIERRANYKSQIQLRDINIRQVPILERGSVLQFKPRRDVAEWPAKLPLDWSADPFYDRNWRFQLHAWRVINPLLWDYFKTHNKARLRQAFDYALDWFRFHYEQGGQSDYAWYDMSAGIRAMKLALFLDRYHAGELQLSTDEAVRLVTLVDEHARRLQVESYIAMSNHGLFQVFGLNLLCVVASDREPCSSGRDFATRMLTRILDHQFTDEGVHRENSPGYHEFTRKTLIRLGALSHFKSDQLVQILKKAEAVEPWLIDPSGRFVAVGDTDASGRKPLAVAPDSPPLVGDFTRSGYAIVRDADSMLFVTGMSHNHHHKHADDLSFVLFEHGRPLFVDTGKYGYKDDPMNIFIETAAAHNTVSLQNREIRPMDLVYVGSALKPIEATEGGFRITGSIERPGLFTQAREIRYVPGRSLFIRDELSSGLNQQFVSSLHLARDLTPNLVPGGFEVSLPDGKRVTARLEETDCRIETARGQKDPILGWETVGYLKMEPASVVRAICPGRQRTITWNVSLQ